MRLRTMIAVLAGTAVAVRFAAAQDSPPPATLQITTFELAPATMGAWRNGLAKLAVAAKAANLPALEVGWFAYNEGNRTILVGLKSRDELFTNNRLMQRIDAVNPDGTKEAREAFASSPGRVLSVEILEHAPDLSYTPAGTPVERGGVSVTDYVIAPGKGQAFNDAMKALNKARTDIKYPYVVNVYRTRMGEARTQVVTNYDTREAFFGKNNTVRLVGENTAAQEAFGAARRALVQSVTSITTRLGNYQARLSYPPTN